MTLVLPCRSARLHTRMMCVLAFIVSITALISTRLKSIAGSESMVLTEKSGRRNVSLAFSCAWWDSRDVNLKVHISPKANRYNLRGDSHADDADNVDYHRKPVFFNRVCMRAAKDLLCVFAERGIILHHIKRDIKILNEGVMSI